MIFRFFLKVTISVSQIVNDHQICFHFRENVCRNRLPLPLPENGFRIKWARFSATVGISDSVSCRLSRRHLSVLNLVFNFAIDASSSTLNWHLLKRYLTLEEDQKGYPQKGYP